MKRLPLLLTCTALIGLSGCATMSPEEEARERAREQAEDDRDDAEYRREHRDEPIGTEPKVGMSKAQIRALYGDPSNKTVSSRGETWNYWFNRGHAFIPYNFGYKPRMGNFTFNSAGRLTEFNYNE